ncbi:RHTO0S11e01838g1_1 [Rhodotorula toruloides]|uniref:RHTO0S11e01838g1_1 n=1 Tax=Rhodotorula toruloides TaxID=5286 RepID=A0A061B6L1_RHOTO|nr:RHTO0S11e01838g1_1 [Rhodotorula toruloides]
MDATSAEHPSPLLRLPHELVDHIFCFAYATPHHDTPVPPGPLCRTLQPFIRTHLYRRVRIRSQPSLDLFCSTVAAKPDLAAAVIELTIDLSAEERAYRDAAHADEDGPRPIPRFVGVLKASATKLTAMSCKLVNLRQLALVECPAVLGDAVLLDGPEGALSRLEVLNVDAWEPRNGQRKGRREFNKRLATFPTLRTLRLSVRDTGLPIVPRADEFSAPCKSLRTLDVDAWRPDAGDPSYDIGRLFPNLRSFVAHQLEEYNTVIPMVETLPNQLEELYLWRYHEFFGRLMPVDIVPLLPSFPRLLYLHLSQGTFTPDSLLRYLRAAPQLRQLSFGCASDISDATLLAIVSLPHLESLELDHALGHQGESLLEQFEQRQFRDGATVDPVWDPLDWDWQEPEFPPGATLEGIESVVSLAQIRGIKVQGTAIGIPRDWEAAWRRERVTVVAEHFVTTGDLSWLEPSGVNLVEVTQYLGGSLRSLREKHGVPSPLAGVASPLEQPL